MNVTQNHSLMESALLLGFCIRAAATGVVDAVGSSTTLSDKSASTDKLKVQELENTLILSIMAQWEDK